MFSLFKINTVGLIAGWLSVKAQYFEVALDKGIIKNFHKGYRNDGVNAVYKKLWEVFVLCLSIHLQLSEYSINS